MKRLLCLLVMSGSSCYGMDSQPKVLKELQALLEEESGESSSLQSGTMLSAFGVDESVLLDSELRSQLQHDLTLMPEGKLSEETAQKSSASKFWREVDAKNPEAPEEDIAQRAKELLSSAVIESRGKDSYYVHGAESEGMASPKGSRLRDIPGAVKKGILTLRSKKRSPRATVLPEGASDKAKSILGEGSPKVSPGRKNKESPRVSPGANNQPDNPISTASQVLGLDQDSPVFSKKWSSRTQATPPRSHEGSPRLGSRRKALPTHLWGSGRKRSFTSPPQPTLSRQPEVKLPLSARASEGYCDQNLAQPPAFKYGLSQFKKVLALVSIFL